MCTQEQRKRVMQVFNDGAQLVTQEGTYEYVFTREIGKFRITEFAYDRATPRTILRKSLSEIIEVAEDITPIGYWKVQFDF